MVVIHTHVQLKPGTVDAVKKHLEATVPTLTVGIDGYERSYYSVNEEESSFTAFGVWSSREKFQAFAEGGGMKSAMDPLVQHFAYPPEQMVHDVFFGWSADRNG